VNPTVDRDQHAALRRLREAFGDVQVLKVVDHQPGRDSTPSPASQSALVEEVMPARA
jgi:hypothetical protein